MLIGVLSSNLLAGVVILLISVFVFVCCRKK